MDHPSIYGSDGGFFGFLACNAYATGLINKQSQVVFQSREKRKRLCKCSSVSVQHQPTPEDLVATYSVTSICHKDRGVQLTWSIFCCIISASSSSAAIKKQPPNRTTVCRRCQARISRSSLKNRTAVDQNLQIIVFLTSNLLCES